MCWSEGSMPLRKAVFRCFAALLLCFPGVAMAATLFEDVTLIDGTGGPAKRHQNVLVGEGWIVSIQDYGRPLPKDVTVISAAGKTMIPMLVNAHGHVGLLKGQDVDPDNLTRANIQRHLVQYRAYGVGAVLSMGTDELKNIYDLRRLSQSGELLGAKLYTAGRGFGAVDGAPPRGNGFSHVFRPKSAEEAQQQVRRLAEAEDKPDVIKIWVDDMNGTAPKMRPDVYRAIIDEAHRHRLRVAAHVYYLEDARSLVESGVDILAHSIRDALVDESLLDAMRLYNVTYIPTLSLDEFAYVYQGRPEWMEDPFFRASLEEGVFDSIDNPAYRYKIRANPKTAQDVSGHQIALVNLKRIYDAGVRVALGTDSGAMPIRPIGFSEHHELALMVEAGLTPLEAIRVATRNSAMLLRIPDTGTLEVGKRADFILLDGNPEDDIRNTRRISSVWQGGRQVSTGPLSDAVLKAVNE